MKFFLLGLAAGLLLLFLFIGLGFGSKTGQPIFFRQGDEANHLYILIEGAVDLTIKTGEKIDFMTSKIEKEGAVFGMPSLVEPFRYNVTATCLRPSKVLIMEADHIKKKTEEDPKMGMEMMKKLASIYFNRLNEMRTGVLNLIKIFEFKTP